MHAVRSLEGIVRGLKSGVFMEKNPNNYIYNLFSSDFYN